MKQKIMAIALAVALAVSGIAPGQTASEVKAAGPEGAELPPETAQEIELGRDYIVHLDEHESAYYKFVPKTDGIYVFSKNNNGDTAAGTLYSNEMKPLYVNIWGEFDIEGYLFAGRTYYLKASSVYDVDASFTFNVSTRLANGLEIFYNEGPVYTTYGEATTLEVVAVNGSDDDSSINYQWRYRDLAVTSEYTNIAGATTNTYVLPQDNKRYSYECLVTSGGVSRTASFAIYINTDFKVGSAIGDELLPEDEEGICHYGVTVTYGEKTSLAVTASSKTGNLTYQWYKNRYGGEDGIITGATESTYELPQDKNIGRYYYCEVTDGIYLKGVSFNVTLDTGLTVSTDAETTVMVEFGKTTTLEVTAAGGAGDLTYQWYEGEEAEEDDIIPGATGSTYELLIDKNISHFYSCKVTDGIISKVVNFDLVTGLKAYSSTGTDEEGEEGSSSIRNVSVPYGGSTTLEVTATGSTGELQYTWYKYSYNDNYEGSDRIEGAAGSTYEVFGDESCPGEYYCRVTDGITTRSVCFYITLDTGLTAVSDTGTDHSNKEGSSSNRDVITKYGEKTTLTVTASGGAGALSYQWYNSLKASSRFIIAGATDSSYELPEDVKTSEYSCRITDGIITKTVLFRVTLDSGIVITNATGDTSSQSGADIYKSISVDYGENLTLTVTATGGVGNLSYEWHYTDEDDDYYDDVAVEDRILGVTESYTITGNNNVRDCYCIVRDNISFKRVFFEITVNSAFSVSSKSGIPYGNNPNCQRVIKTNSGQTVNLSIEASSQMENLTYNWVRTDVIPHQEIACNGNSYSVKAEDKAAIYDCNVSDGIHTESLRFVVLPDIDFHWDKTSETLTISGTGSIPSDIFRYSGCNAEGLECMNNLNSLKVIIEDGVTGIDDNALTIERKSNLNYPCDITIPASVKSIGEKAIGYESYSYTDSDSEAYSRKSATCTIHGYKDTAAQKYAADNGIAFKLLTETSAVNLKDCSISITPQSMIYTGSALKPKVTVKNGTNTLKEGTDYSLSYSNNTNIGTALVTITGKNNYTGNITKPFSITVKKGSAYTIGAYKYKITNGSEVSFAGLKNKKTTKVNVPKTVKIGGKNFKVTSIDAKALRKTSVTSVTVGNNVKTIGNSAFEGCSKLTKVTIGTGVTKIGTSTFKSCKKLGSITIKSAKLKTVGKNSLKGIKSNAKIKVPSKKLKDYKKLLKGKGQGKKVKITK